ncbi:MAG: LTA synthase family protein [Lachnospiraceae bacterium]|nr:LTA synthase family protein [Lachnospiraceae bacterium]
MEQNGYIYIADGNEDVYKKITEHKEGCGYVMLSDEMLFGRKEVLPGGEIFIDIIKEYYSPLLEKQDILLINGEKHVVEVISYMKTEKEAHIQMILKVAEELALIPAAGKILNYLIDYMVSKNISLLKKIYSECEDGRFKLNTLILKKTAEFFGSAVPEQEKAKLILMMLQENILKTDRILEKKLDSDNVYDIYNSLRRHEQELRNYKQQAVKKIEQNKKPKNLIVFHMESISNEIFGNHRYEFRNIEKLMNDSLNLGKFYSSATSSAMAISDFIHGNDFEMDKFTNFHDMMVEGKYGKGLYKILEEHGYVTLGIGYNYFPKTEEVNSHGIWDSECGAYKWIDDYESFMTQLTGFIEEQKDNPFAIHVWNLMPHVGQKCQDTEDAANFYDRINMAYESLNMTIETICDILKRNHLMDQTVIAGYGDHGDDKWTRSMNAGFTHTIEPYHNIINTPAFIYDSRLEPLYSDELVSLVDLKPTLLYLTGNETEEEFEAGGINLFKECNNYVYSKRLFANQQYYEDIQAYSMMKLHDFSDREFRNPAYAIISKKYTLLVSNQGCEMFMNQLDPFSYNNVLNFYRMDEKGDLVSFDNQGAWRGHFRTIMMREEQVYDVVSAFYDLSAKLKDRIQLHEAMIGEELKYAFDRGNFCKIRKRGFTRLEEKG